MQIWETAYISSLLAPYESRSFRFVYLGFSGMTTELNMNLPYAYYTLPLISFAEPSILSEIQSVALAGNLSNEGGLRRPGPGGTTTHILQVCKIAGSETYARQVINQDIFH